jgi:hypothetical protein
MLTQIVQLDKARKHPAWDALMEILRTADFPSLVSEMNGMWPESGKGGTCCCLFGTGGMKFFGYSDREDGTHAEEDCMQKILSSGYKLRPDSAWLMYVDLEPCYNDRYPVHNCKGFLRTELVPLVFGHRTTRERILTFGKTMDSYFMRPHKRKLAIGLSFNGCTTTRQPQICC